MLGTALTYLLARSLMGARAAVIASLLCALYSVLIFFEGRLLFDSVLTFLATLWLTMAVLGENKRSVGWYALLGVLLGLICIMRPTFLAVAPFLIGYVAWMHFQHRTGALRCLLAFGVAFLFPILAVTIDAIWRR